MQCFFLFLVGPAETTSLFQATTFQDHLNNLLDNLLRLESPECRLQIIIEQLNLKLALYLQSPLVFLFLVDLICLV